MNITAFFASLGAALLAQVSSVGAAVISGFATILMSFTTDQRQIILNVKQKFSEAYTARKAQGQSEVDAIEGAATDAFNEFCGEEKGEFTQVAGATITLLEAGAKQAAGIIGTQLTTNVVPAIAASAAAAIQDGAAAAEKKLGA